MSKGSKRNLIIAIVSLTFSSALFLFMMLTITGQGEALSEQITTLNRKVAQENSYQELKQLSDDTVADRERLSGFYLQKTSDSITVLNLIESIARDTKVSLTTNSVKPVEVSEEDWIEIDLSFGGSRFEVEQFVKILETLPYVLRLTSVDLTTRNNEWEAKTTMQIKVLNYDG